MVEMKLCSKGFKKQLEYKIHCPNKVLYMKSISELEWGYGLTLVLRDNTNYETKKQNKKNEFCFQFSFPSMNVSNSASNSWYSNPVFSA